MKLGRNDPCHCGSGQKYKKCHQAEDDAKKSAELQAQAAERAAAAAAAAEAEGEEGEDKEAAASEGPAKHAHAKVQTRQRPKVPTAHNANLPRRGAV
ncbi:MAG TPA: SEC-C metal-binding domain-containing protein [Polyangiales bacterium]|nr:SEC-C metal-binding domain-containing protein [Polyangiales bacterium]